jgi:hypothetical protein
VTGGRGDADVDGKEPPTPFAVTTSWSFAREAHLVLTCVSPEYCQRCKEVIQGFRIIPTAVVVSRVVTSPTLVLVFEELLEVDAVVRILLAMLGMVDWLKLLLYSR